MFLRLFVSNGYGNLLHIEVYKFGSGQMDTEPNVPEAQILDFLCFMLNRKISVFLSFSKFAGDSTYKSNPNSIPVQKKLSEIIF